VEVVSQEVASWNQVLECLQELEALTKTRKKLHDPGRNRVGDGPERGS
jgi:hypothetical protein